MASEANQGVRRDAAELVTAAVLALIGAAAIWDSRRIGAGWGGDGPQSGYFPFWIGVLLVAASLGTLIPVLRARRGAPPELFVTWPQLRRVLSVFLPAVVYVAAIHPLGIYVASALLVVYFMMRIGEFSWRSAVPAGIATAIVAFLTFEIWFLVGLPKGPLEEFLGY